jgi:hypothetical protein
MNPIPTKPLGQKGYGTIPHLPGSRRGPADKGVNDGQYRILCVRPDRSRPKGDKIWVQEKLDGSNTGAVKLNGEIIPINRAGHRAETSDYVHHRLWHEWVTWNQDRFHQLLDEGERVMGEWLVLAHGTRYALPHEPFVAFDLIRNGWERCPIERFYQRLLAMYRPFEGPRLLYGGGPLAVEEAVRLLDDPGVGDGRAHGAVDPAEGVVYRLENGRGDVELLAKYVRPEKVDGWYLFERDGPELKRVPGVDKHGNPLQKFVPLLQPDFTWNSWPSKDDTDSLYAAWVWAYQ